MQKLARTWGKKEKGANALLTLVSILLILITHTRQLVLGITVPNVTTFRT